MTRTSISLKLFLGFLLVIFLNVLFVVVVARFSDLYFIARTLGWQNNVKNGLLRISAMHTSQRTNFVILDKLGRRESIGNIQQTGESIVQYMDTLDREIQAIRSVDTAISANQGTWQISHQVEALRQAVSLDLRADTDRYHSLVLAFSDLRDPQTNLLSDTAAARALRNDVGAASDTLLARLRNAERMVDDLTRLRLDDISNRIASARRTTTFMLGGMTLFALLFAVIFSRAITTSLRRLKDATAKVARGDFAIDSKGYPEDEIGELAEAFAGMARDLRVAQEELVRSKRLAAMGEIIASVNHEINNPLMVVAGNAQLLEMSLADRPEDQQRARAIVEESERISQVTRKLRELRNPVVEQYAAGDQQMINLEKSTREKTA
jgi:nitrogen fixation/metabolism regulation signal transduction histidine kinase